MIYGVLTFGESSEAEARERARLMGARVLRSSARPSGAVVGVALASPEAVEGVTWAALFEAVAFERDPAAWAAAFGAPREDGSGKYRCADIVRP